MELLFISVSFYILCPPLVHLIMLLVPIKEDGTRVEENEVKGPSHKNKYNGFSLWSM